MDSKVTIISILLTAASLLILAVNLFWGASYRNTTQISPHVAYLTSPVNIISGSVTRVGKNGFDITKTASVGQNSETNPTVYPTMNLTYSVTVTNKTRFNRMVTPSDYTEKTGIPLPHENLSLGDIKTGETVTILTDEDLRFVTNQTIVAKSVELPAAFFAVSGTVDHVENGVITLQTSPAHKSTILLTASTSVARKIFASNPIPDMRTEKADQSTLKPGMTITVYLKEHVGEKPMNALHIEYSVYPLPDTPSPQTDKQSTSSAEPSI